MRDRTDGRRVCARPIVVGHRGNAGEAPENSLEGFEQAIQLGVDMIEVDVRATSDGVVVLHHDATVAGHVISEMTRDDLGRIRLARHGDAFASPQTVPTLRETLDLARGRVAVNLDVKVGEAIGPMVATVRDANMCHDVVVSGCTEEWAARIRKDEPTLPVFLNMDASLARLAKTDTDAFVRESLDRALRAGLRALNYGHRYVTAEFVRTAHRRGVAVWTWTVDHPDRMRELIDWGVDGITSNFPKRLLNVLSERAPTDGAR